MTTHQDAKTLFLLHHSHTDIGYTEYQTRVEQWHVDFIREALRIISDSRRIRDQHFPGFKWNCETFWAVERFFEEASPSEISDFVEAVRSADIGISASYLNFTELLDYEVLSNVTERAARFGQAFGITIDSAMTADINGYSWGFSQALHDNGVRNLFTCIHTHHGMFPLGQPQTPFFWQTPRGDHLLVWNGEHYHLGNELRLVPGAVSSYQIKDECDAQTIFCDNWKVAQIRIPRYFEQLQKQGYGFDFVPVMASGLRSDNAPPSEKIIDFIIHWNREHGDEIRIEMTTLSEFFQRVRESLSNIPTHTGDWPDWWSDGPSGNARTTKLFRQAQRDLSYYRTLLRRYPELPRSSVDGVEQDLALYAEHTFGHASSVSHPWHDAVQSIESRKMAFASSAYSSIQELTDAALRRLGAASLRAGRTLRYKILNPLNDVCRGPVHLNVGHYEYHELSLDLGAEVWDTERNDRLPCQLEETPRGADFWAYLELESGEERILELRPAPNSGSTAMSSTNTCLETPFARIEWQPREGITSWTDKTSGESLLRSDRQCPPFAPVYEVTPIADRNQVCSIRGEMRLNRKGPNVQRSVGRLTAATNTTVGDVYCSVELRYQVTGMTLYDLEVRSYLREPRTDVTIRMHKESVWDPENVYVALPFACSSPFQLWLDKAGARIRPGTDQLPGTLADFYSVQEGLALVSRDMGLAIATPDSYLIQPGSLDHGRRRLYGDPELAQDEAHIYAWLMTNYWETNFSATLGGFYEFRYFLKWGNSLASPERALAECRNMNRGFCCFRMEA